MTFHSKLSPSSSERWLNCAGSLQYTGTSGSNFYADQGTAAHALLELCHRIEGDPYKFLGKEMYAGHVVDENMADAVGHALDYVRSYIAQHKNTKLLIEHEVDPAKLVKCETRLASGTPDLILDNPEAQELIVIDYKHGVNAVEVEGNTQILQYLVGYMAQRLTRSYKKYVAVIIQPRSEHEDGPVRPHEYTHAQVLAHAKRLQRRIVQIKKQPDQRTAGAWCRWCPGCKTTGDCRTFAEWTLEQAGLEFGEVGEPRDPRRMTLEEASAVITMEAAIEAWLKALRGRLELHLLRGHDVSGWKLVYGITRRSWVDERKVAKQLLRMGRKPDEIAPRTLLGVPGIEKLFKKPGKKAALPAPLARLVVRSIPALHLAPATDPRPAIQRGQEFKRNKR